MYELEQINKRAFDDPEKFVRDCCDEYEAVIESVAEDILNNLNNSRVVLLSGPSGSTKTTTAKKICDRLLARGHSAHEVSLDNYLLDVTPENTPILPDGRYDLESPDCLDMSLLLEHFDHIEDRKEIKIPKFDFHTQCRLPETGKVIRPDENTIVIFEGIHALNKDIAFEHPQAYTLFVNADPDISYEGRILVSKDDVRFARRTIRDDKFRGHSFAETYKKRDTVIRGENLYILPSAETAARKIDSFHPCELGVRGAHERDHIIEIDPARAAQRFGDRGVGPFDLDQREVVGVLRDVPHAGLGAGADACQRRADALHGVGLGAPEALAHGAHQLAEQVDLGGEVPVEQALGDPGLGADVADPRRRETALGEQTHRGLDELALSFAPLLGERSIARGGRHDIGHRTSSVVT